MWIEKPLSRITVYKKVVLMMLCVDYAAQTRSNMTNMASSAL
jgi:hypothetical protein